MKKALRPQDRPRRFRTTRGLRRLSYEEAYNRRTTDTSRARVMELYGRTKPPKATMAPPVARNAPVANGSTPIRITDPKPGSSGAPKPYTPSTGTRGTGSNGPQNLGRGNLAQGLRPKTRRRRRRSRPDPYPTTGGVTAPRY